MVNNPPFPYHCKIVHYNSVDAFEGVAEEEVLYDGECDIEGDKNPTLKEGVLVNKCKVYINDLGQTNRVYNVGDALFINRLGREEEYVLNDYWNTNFGTTIQCDIVEN